MKAFTLALTLLLLATVHSNLTLTTYNGDFNSLDPNIGSISLADEVNVVNYYGCKTWKGQVCIECSSGYHFNNIGVCCQISDLCSQFNVAQGVCQACYQGYGIVNGTCQLAAEDNGCALWNGNTCIQCSMRWYFNSQGVCQIVSDYCSTWDSNGNCLTCYGGFILKQSACIVNPKPWFGISNPLCAGWSDTVCVSCAKRAYFNSAGVCIPVDSQCQTWDPSNGVCLSCYGGYTLSNGACSQSAIVSPSDPGCSSWNSNLSICLKCSNRFYFNSNGKCSAVSDFCATWEQVSGNCTSCYQGYQVAQGVCCISLDENSPTDPGCGAWDWKNLVCLQCSNNWVFNTANVCVQVSNLCATFDHAGACLTCYSGYTLANGLCSLAPIQRVADAGCASWDWKNQVCLACSSNWVLNNKVCTPVSDQCATFDKTGACLSCYLGYDLSKGNCVLAAIQQVSDVGCATWDWSKQICLQCSNNWVFNSNKVCTPVSSQCATFDSTGACVSCYLGYNLNKGVCVLAPTQLVSDVGCATWDWSKQICLQCSNNWVFNTNKVCTPVSSQCATFDSTGTCLSCFNGYNLNQGSCVLAPIQQVTDVGCATWDWTKQICLQCSNNWVFNNNKVCIPVSSQCATFDSKGACLSCYIGYNLNQGVCILAPIQQVSDVGCATWDWLKQTCLQCSSNWVFNSNKVCTPVSSQCATFDNKGACLSCYKGYNLNQGSCALAPIQQVSDAGCGTWDWTNNVCLNCSARFVFNSLKKCVPVNDNCNTWDNSGACTNCYSGYVLNNGACKLGNSLCQSSDSNGACTNCYSGYLLNNGNCVPLSKLANLALYYSICCPQRLATLNQNINNSTTSN